MVPGVDQRALLQDAVPTCCEVGCGIHVWSGVILTVSQSSSLFMMVCKQVPGNALTNRISMCSHFLLASCSASSLNLVNFHIPRQCILRCNYWLQFHLISRSSCVVKATDHLFPVGLSLSFYHLLGSSSHSFDTFSCSSERKQFHFFGYLCCLPYFF